MAKDNSDVEFVGSHMKSENGYGRNGYQGASSTLPGQVVNTGFLPQVSVPTDDWQTRKVSAEQYPTTFGCGGPKASPKISGKNHRG